MHKSMPNSSYQLSETDCLLHLISLYSHGIFSNAIKIIKIQKFSVIFSHLNASFSIWFGLFLAIFKPLFVCLLFVCIFIFLFLFFSKCIYTGDGKFSRVFFCIILILGILHRALSIGEETLCSFLCMYNKYIHVFYFLHI